MMILSQRSNSLCIRKFDECGAAKRCKLQCARIDQFCQSLLRQLMVQAQTAGNVTVGQHLSFLFEEFHDLILQFFSDFVVAHDSPHYHLNVGVERKVSVARVQSSMSWTVNGIPVRSKNRSQPMRSIHSPMRSCFCACLAQVSTILRTAWVTSGQRGGLFGKKGIASRENLGGVRALEILPPTQIETPSPIGSASGMPGH